MRQYQSSVRVVLVRQHRSSGETVSEFGSSTAASEFGSSEIVSESGSGTAASEFGSGGSGAVASKVGSHSVAASQHQISSGSLKAGTTAQIRHGFAWLPPDPFC